MYSAASGPQPRGSVVAGGDEQCPVWAERNPVQHAGVAGKGPPECPGEGPGRAVRAWERGAAGDVGLSGSRTVTERGGAGERLGARIAGLE
jgi:hypothetical protein